MANRSRTCSLSQQNCDELYPNRNTALDYTRESCVPDTPWFTGDVGICGWVGAPCTARGGGSNCSELQLHSQGASEHLRPQIRQPSGWRMCKPGVRVSLNQATLTLVAS